MKKATLFSQTAKVYRMYGRRANEKKWKENKQKNLRIRRGDRLIAPTQIPFYLQPYL